MQPLVDENHFSRTSSTSSSTGVLANGGKDVQVHVPAEPLRPPFLRRVFFMGFAKAETTRVAPADAPKEATELETAIR